MLIDETYIHSHIKFEQNWILKTRYLKIKCKCQCEIFIRLSEILSTESSQKQIRIYNHRTKWGIQFQVVEIFSYTITIP